MSGSTDLTDTGPILEFQGQHRWLSNFWECPVQVGPFTWPSAEHAYQAAKSLDPEIWEKTLACKTPGEAKRLGRTFPLRPDWEDIRIDAMRQILEAKFTQNRDLQLRLLATGNRLLVEGNAWGDRFWGQCGGTGHNHLGNLLMDLRQRLALRRKDMAYAGIGSRKTPPPILTLMTGIGEMLAEENLILRSGAASGADTAFEQGCNQAFGGRGGFKQIFLPWPGFEGRTSCYKGPSGEALMAAPTFVSHWHNLSQGAQKLHARNLHQVMGPTLEDPVRFLICWTPGGEITGGTATAIKVAQYMGIPVLNLAVENRPEAVADWISDRL